MIQQSRWYNKRIFEKRLFSSTGLFMHWKLQTILYLHGLMYAYLMCMVAEMLQKWKLIWYKNIFSFNQNNFVFNKIYFHYITFFSWYQNIFLSNQNKFIFNKIYFHYITFLWYQIYFHSIKINLYSVKNSFIIYIFFAFK